MGSSTARLIDACIRLGLAPDLKGDGYRMSGRTFHLIGEESIRVVNVQASKENLEGRARFTLNLGVLFPKVTELVTGRILSGPPKEYDCTLRQRIGELLPARQDTWWELRGEADLPRVSEEIVQAWRDHGKGWLDSRARLAEAVASLGPIDGNPMDQAAMHLVLGNRTAAREVLAKRIKDSSNRTYNRNVREWALKQGMPLEG